MKQEQKEQDSEYNFPYHYVPNRDLGFTQTYTWTWGKNYLSAVEFVLDKIAKSDRKFVSIADVGCGDGRLVKELSSRFPEAKVVGVDYSTKAINLSRAMNPELEFINKNIIEETLGQTFDIITLVEVFEHIPLDACNDFVLALRRLLNPDGEIYLTVPHSNKALSYKHFQHFTSESLSQYFSEYFKIEEVVLFEKMSRWNRVINLLSCNSVFMITHPVVNEWIYQFYKKNFFFANKNDCGRIFLKLTKL